MVTRKRKRTWKRKSSQKAIDSLAKLHPDSGFWGCLYAPDHRGYQLSHGPMAKKQPRLGFISKVSRLLKSIDVLTNEADIQREERLHA